ncbi:MAG: hypothetical protein RL154_958 [Pseudomonadota bacterium]
MAYGRSTIQGTFLQVVIFTEAGTNYGFGHLSRCEALKDALIEFGVDVKLYVRDEIEWLDNTLELAKDADIAVIDSYHAPIAVYEEVAKSVKTCVWFDDENRLNYPSGIIINSAKTPILRKPFWDVLPRQKAQFINKIFISLGGTNNFENVNKLILATKNRFKNASLVVASNADKNLLHKNDELLIGCTAEQIANKMLECDAAICAGGQTMQELSSLGIPTVAIITAKNQAKNIKEAIKNKNIIGSIDILKDNFAKLAVDKLKIDNITPLEVQTKIVAGMIIKDAMVKKLKIDCQKNELFLKSFCNITKEEALQIFAWRNDIRVRMWSLNRQKVELKNHLNFISLRKIDEKSFYWLAYKNKEPFGVVNLSKIDWQNLVCNVGIYIRPDFFGKGLGSALVSALAQFAFKANFKKLIAEIASKNIASIKAHTKSGFEQEGAIKKYFLDAQDLLILGLNSAK